MSALEQDWSSLAALGDDWCLSERPPDKQKPGHVSRLMQAMQFPMDLKR